MKKGTIVKYRDGWMRVKAVFKDSVNLSSVFGSKTTVKHVPMEEVVPDEAGWNEHWSKSERYMCM